MEAPDWLKTNVSRETLGRLQVFAALALKWNPKINLISRSSVEHIWERHIWDAVQIADITEFTPDWTDLGSGGGFPGVVLSILSMEKRPDMKTTLIESDQRKCAFLRTAIREIGLNAVVKSQRIEEADPMSATCVSARALAELDQLLGLAQRHVAENGVCIFPKGQTWEKEIVDAQQNWSFSYKAHKSKTNLNAAILTIKDIKRV